MKLVRIFCALITLWLYAGRTCAMPLEDRVCWNRCERLTRNNSIQRVAIFGNDKRALLSVGASSLNLSREDTDRIRSTTGYVLCPGTKYQNASIASAVLIGDGSHILTTAHTFIDHKTMKFREPVQNCYFQTQAARPQRVPMGFSETDKSGLVIGSTFPDDKGDFAVAELQRKLRNVKPFPLDLSMKPIKDGEKTMVVSALMRDLHSPGLKEPIVQECPVHDVTLALTTVLYSSCDIDHGASGSVHLRRDANGNFIIKGIVVGTDEKQKREDYSYISGQVTMSLGVDGEMLGDVLARDPTIRPGQGALK